MIFRNSHFLKAIASLSLIVCLCFGVGCDYFQTSETISNPSVSKNVIPEFQTTEELEQGVYRYNNQFLYDSSILAIHHFIDQKHRTDEECCQAFLFLSDTYKRLFSYSDVLIYLDSAMNRCRKSPNKIFFESTITCRKAFALFDTNNYTAADSLMKILAKANYAQLDDETRSKIIMQEAYLLFLNKKYVDAEQLYNVALSDMRKGSPCDLPMIYGKQIELYGAVNDTFKMNFAYRMAMACADSCQILKYKLYAAEMLFKTLRSRNDFLSTYHAQSVFDSLSTIYNQNEHLNKITELDKRYQNEKKEQQLVLNTNRIKQKNTLIALLVSCIVVLVLIMFLYLLWRRQRILRHEKNNKIQFANQLIQKTEEERTRIANDLHDGVGHELLTLRRSLSTDQHVLQTKIDTILNEIRSISHNLHPVLFEKIGLKLSIEQLLEQIAQKDDFMVSAYLEYEGQLSSTVELQVYRIVQEALNNILKYSEAHAAKISMAEKNKKIFLEIKDNGKGFDVEQVTKRGHAFGLFSILQRSEAIGGHATIHSNDSGTTVSLTIPITAHV